MRWEPSPFVGKMLNHLTPHQTYYSPMRKRNDLLSCCCGPRFVIIPMEQAMGATGLDFRILVFKSNLSKKGFWGEKNLPYIYLTLAPYGVVNYWGEKNGNCPPPPPSSDVHTQWCCKPAVRTNPPHWESLLNSIPAPP